MLTGDQAAQVLNDLGYDTPQKFAEFVGFVQTLALGLKAAGIDTREEMDAFFGYVGPLVMRNQLLSTSAGIRAAARTAAEEAEQQAQQLDQQAAAIDRQLASR